MVVPFGFSVGDCIAVSLLIKDAVRALDSAHGASAEYQQVIRELWDLDRALLEVFDVSRGFESTIELNALSHAVKRAADQCRICIETFLDKIKGYSRSLGSKCGSGSKWKDISGKIGWAILKGDELKTFRTEINGHASAINMLMITASVSLANLNNKTLREQMDDAKRIQKTTACDQMLAIQDIKDDVQRHSVALQVHGKTVTRLANGIKYLSTISTTLKTIMVNIWMLSLRSYKILVDLNTRVPREFCPCWIQEPFTLIDALGRATPVHLELINSWNVLNSVLAARFQDQPGERKIEYGEYIFEDCGMEISRHSSFQTSFLPGRKIYMSMVFKWNVPVERNCPACQAITESDGVQAVTCKCGLHFQRLEEIIETPKEPHIIASPTDRSETVNHPYSTLRAQPSLRKRPSAAETEDEREEMRMFKRVRLHHTRNAFTALEDRIDRSAAQTSSNWSIAKATDVPVLLYDLGIDGHSPRGWIVPGTQGLLYVLKQLELSYSNKSSRLSNVTK